MIRLFVTLLSAAILVFSGHTLAQDATVAVRAVLLDPTNPEPKFFVGKPGETMVPLKLLAEGLPEPQRVNVENGSLSLFASDEVDKNNPALGLSATVKVPAGAKRLIAIILPNEGGKIPYSMFVLDDDPLKFPWGESKAVNITPVDFAMEVGEHKFPIPSGKVIPVPKVTKVDEYNRAQTNFYYKQGDQWVIAAERQMQYLPALRRVFLIFKEPKAVAPDVRTIIDQRLSDDEKTR